MTNKETALKLLDAFFRRDLDEMRAMLEETATWWLPPSLGPDHFLSGIDQIFKKLIARADGELTPGSLQYEIQTVTAEGDRVVIECIVRTKLRDGTPTDNNYVYMVTVKDGRVSGVRDHFDTLYASKHYKLSR